MKAIIPILIILLTQNLIPKKANKIVIHTQKTANENFQYFGKYLVQNGFIFENTNKDFLTFKTDSKEVKSGGGRCWYKMLVSFAQNDINIKIQIGLRGAGTNVTWYEWNYASYKGKYQNAVFKDIDPILRKYSEELEYVKE